MHPAAKPQSLLLVGMMVFMPCLPVVLTTSGAVRVAIYPGPPGIPPSDDYAVEVVQARETLTSFTHKNASDDPEDNHIESEVMAGIESNPALRSHFLGVSGPAIAETEKHRGIGLGLADPSPPTISFLGQRMWKTSASSRDGSDEPPRITLFKEFP